MRARVLVSLTDSSHAPAAALRSAGNLGCEVVILAKAYLMSELLNDMPFAVSLRALARALACARGKIVDMFVWTNISLLCARKHTSEGRVVWDIMHVLFPSQ